MIVKSFDSVKRFALNSHTMCAGIFTDRRVVFWDGEDTNYSWSLTWNEIANSKIKVSLSTDLHFHFKGRVYELALTSHTFKQARELIDRRIRKLGYKRL